MWFKMKNERQTAQTRKREKPFFAYRSFWKEFDAKKRFAAIGVDQFAVFASHSTNSLGEPYCQYDPTWLWYDTYDFAPFDDQVNDVIGLCHEAKILCMIDLNSPLWLARQLYVDSYPAVTLAAAHDRWKEETRKYVRAFVEHAEKEFGDRIICYILMCGVTDEWMDYSNGADSPEKLLAYRAWCARKGLPEPADIPGPAARDHISHEHTGMKLRDPMTDHDAVQYWHFHSEFNVETILEFAALVRSLVPRPVELGVFYGYILELDHSVVHRAHLAYEQLESSSDIDFLISPGDYHDRDMGGGSGFMTPNGTVKCHGKNCLYEIDHRTTTANMKLTPYVELPWMIRWKSPAEDRAGLRREFCRTLFHGSHLWWFDMWGKFYETQEQMDVIAKCREIWMKYADRSFTPEAEIALIVDPESAYLVGINHFNPILLPVLNAANRLGAPCEIYSLNDLPHIPDRIKFAVFTGVVRLDERNRAELDGFAKGRHLLWNGPAGLTDGKVWQEQSLPGARFEDYRTITADDLRAEAEKAGVHFFTEERCPVWFGRNMLSVHCAKGGRKKISLPKPYCQAEELFSGKIIAVNGTSFEYEFEEPETALFRLS